MKLDNDKKTDIMNKHVNALYESLGCDLLLDLFN